MPSLGRLGQYGQGLVSAQIETLGPKTFFVFRYFQAGIHIDDGSDEMSPWRRNPWLNVDEAKMLQQVPGIRSVTWQENSGGPVSAGRSPASPFRFIALKKRSRSSFTGGMSIKPTSVTVPQARLPPSNTRWRA